MLVFALARRGGRVSPAMAPLLEERAGRRRAVGVAYWIAIWAMTVAPIAIVAALRETSVLFGAAIAVILLKEPLRGSRIVRGADDRRRAGADPARLSQSRGEAP